MELRSSDITEDICRKCAACCYSSLGVEGDLRNLEFMERVYGGRLEVTWRGLCGCGCGTTKYKGRVKEVCPELEESGDGYRCKDYRNRPELCKAFKCVTWATVAGHKETELTKVAARALFDSRAGSRAQNA